MWKWLYSSFVRQRRKIVKMNLIILLLSLVAYGSTAPQYGEEHDYHLQHEVQHTVNLHTTPIPILSHKSESHKDGYQYSFKSGNGIHAEESGYVKKSGVKDDDDVVVMHGSVSYTGPDGIPIKLTYIADEHGFQPQGSHLPTPVPMPLELQKAYEQALEHHQHQHQQHQQHHQHQHQHLEGGEEAVGGYEEEGGYQGHYQ